MNRKVKYSIWGIILLFVVAAILLTSKNVLVHANIVQNANNEDLHFKTLATKVSDEKPTITILTHGLDGNPSHWSNDIKRNEDGILEGEGKFAYDDLSIIEKICKIFPIGINIFEIRRPTEEQIEYIKYNVDDKSNPPKYEFKYVNKISDFFQHTIIVVRLLNDENKTQEEAYDDLNYIIDNVSQEYLNWCGKLPRLNLIGHSRGGLINMDYAINHPKNIASLVSIGTPYNGSTYDNAIVELLGIDEFNTVAGKCITGECGHDYYFCNLETRKNTWNAVRAQNNHIKLHAISGTFDITFLNKLIFEPPYLEEWTGETTAAHIRAGVPVISFLFPYYSLTFGATTYALLPGDIAVDTDSQQAKGYNGVQVYNKEFTSNNCDLDKRSSVEVPMPIPHILEPYDSEIHDYILENVTFGAAFDTSSIGDNEISIDGLNISNQNLKIPNYINGKKVTQIGESAFLNCTSLRMIKFDDESNLKIISNQAFMNCTSLSTIRLPASVEEIKNSAFFGCSNLNKVTFEENSELSTIGANAFRDCTYLNHNINIAFYLPMNVTSIGEYAFYGCTKIDLFYVNYKIQNLEKGVFSGWTANQTIHMVGISSIPDSWNDLWNLDCNANIVWGVNEQNDALFKYRFIDDKTAFEVSIGENVFKDDLPPVLKIPSSYNGIPVKRIANNAFTFRSYIYEVEIPDSIETIGEKAFYLCLDLEKITFSSNSQLKNIQDYAFSGSKIEEIVIPASVTYIGNNVFRDCYKLETIEVESSSNDFSCENGILYNKTKTKLVACPYLYPGSLVIPNTVTEIQNSAFANCKNLTSVTIPATLTIVPNYAFFGCVNLRNVSFAKMLSNQSSNPISLVNEIGDGAFEECVSLKSIDLPGNVSKIGDNAFKGCTSLGTGTQLDGSYLPGIIFEADTEINSIGNSAFFGCVGLKEFTFPYGVASIGESAFEDCTKLKSIYIPMTVRTIGSKAFKNCEELSNVNIFSSLLDIGSYAFAGCVGLRSIVIPESVQSMGYGTFENCDYLTIYTEQDSLQMQSVWKYDWNSSHRPVFWSCTLNILNEVVSFKKVSALLPNGSLDYPNAVNGISEPYKEGYILEGWYNNAQLTGTRYTVETIVNAPDGTYYINWEKPLVKFNLNGGTGNFTQLTVDAYSTISKPTNTPIKTGNIFKYWALSDDLSKEYDWDKPITEDIVLVAVWELKSYSVVFDLNGGNADISELTVQHGATIDEPSDAPQKSGYFFKYWSLSADLTKEYDWQTPITGDVTLVAVWGQITTPDGLKFTLINNGAGYEVSKGSAEIDGVIELPSAYNGKPVIKIASNGFLNCSNLSGIIIPSSVTAIGKDAFKGTAIWDDSNDVVYADKWVVGYKLSIGDLVLKSDTIGISDYAFYGKGIVGINLPSSLKCIGSSAFQNCNKLTEVIFADNVVLESIGSYAFANSALTSISITETVKTIGNRAFDSCKDLTNITVEPENTVYKSDGNCLIRKTDNVLLQGCKNSVIPNYITIIGERAFSNISSLTSITIPYGVEEIGDYAFSSCSSLTSIILPSSVTAIGTFAFYYCSNLSEIELPDSVISLGKYAFAGCKNLIEVTLPDNLVVLKTNTFYGCSALSNIVISENLETIENDAFSGCYNLTVINIPKNIISIGNSAFYDCRNLTAINVDSQNSAYSSVDGVLYDKSQTVLICYPVKKFGEIAMQSGITEIGSYAFFGNGMTQIIIPASVTTIGDYAFSGCGDLTGVYFESGSMLIDLGIGAFEGCLNLTGIILPSGVTELSSNLFANCENILYVTFEGISNLEIISDTAFYCCYNLLAFRIPETVTSIGNDAFGECYSIADITIPCDVMYVGANAFSGWSSEQTIRVSSEYIAYGYWDYYWSDNCEAQIVWEEAIVDYSYAFEYNYIEDEEGNYGYEISAGSGYILELNYVVIPAYFEGIELCHVHRACQYLF